jgi:hypothetical protein
MNMIPSKENTADHDDREKKGSDSQIYLVNITTAPEDRASTDPGERL